MEYQIGTIIGMKKITEIYRNKFGRLTATTQCVMCGKITYPYLDSLKNEKYQSCTCTLIKHGMNRTKIYSIYANIKYRCYNDNHHEFHNYGGKGIKMCDEWLGENGFQNFYQWAINNYYEEGLTIDRIDSNKNYEPNNCQWITRSQNTIKANKTCQHRKANKGMYYGIDSNGNYYEFENANEFGRLYNLDPQKIRSRANSINGSLLNGWKFGFIQERIKDAEIQ